MTFRLYIEKADYDANKVSQRPEAHPVGERIVNEIFTLPVITACKVLTYKRIGMRTFYCFIKKLKLNAILILFHLTFKYSISYTPQIRKRIAACQRAFLSYQIKL